MKGSTKEIIQRHGIKLTKSLGQNFLTDDNIVKRIVSTGSVGHEDLVIEVGPGIGSMTCELAERAGHVIAIEIDRHLIPALEENLKEYTNVTLINKDILEMDLEDLFKSEKVLEGVRSKFENIKVVANLPYYITTPIIMKFLEGSLKIHSMVFMIQKEVAERMAAKPGGKDYGALSVAVQYYSKPEMVFTVPPQCFIPQPEVDSAVVRLNIFQEPPVKLLKQKIFFKTVKAAFGQRRKTLLNALSNSGTFIETKEEIRGILERLGIQENQRGETLTIQQFAELANAFSIRN
ncbi:MAG: 16S rRNA (adenine(1518)-N(6)/adenine(1519)-N(6))-dimethyltransferase RsmA [Clostridia bacterium]|nr:16S rRNA (adenine(1518)-N(6)/adenine(1519)-N(6))-dimethyltransferase RsmA [Clostridia bacterium]